MASHFFRTKSPDHLMAEAAAPERQMKRSLSALDLTALGMGAIIGAGIFALTGTAAAGQVFSSKLVTPVLNFIQAWLSGADVVLGRNGAGPAIMISFMIAGLACGFAALCYAELASMIPVSGSAYTYSYATLGEIIAWIIGWDLILEYAVSNMAVAVGFSAYLNDILDGTFGWHLPAKLAGPPIAGGQLTGAWVNISALIILLILTYILVRGVRESARANHVMVAIKILAVLIFVFGAARSVNTANLHSFLPNGFSGVLTGSAIVF